MGFWNQPKNVVEKYHAIRTNAAILGVPIPIGFGQNRLTARLIWYNDFVAHKAKQQGGKGLGKGGSQYVYTASVIGALCMGPVTGLLSVWDNSGRFVVDGVTETYTVSGGVPSYKTVMAGAFALDHGVSATTAYSYPVNDYGGTGPSTLSGNTQVPLSLITGNTTASDTFPGSALSSNWTINEGSFSCAGNAVSIATVGSDSRALAWWNANTFLADQTVQCTIENTSTAVGPAVRVSSSGGTYYAFYVQGTTWFLFKVLGFGSVTVIASGSHTATVGDVLFLSVAGTTLTAKINGTTVATNTDSSIATGQPGIQGITAGAGSIGVWSATSGVVLTTGQYSLNTATGQYNFSTADNGVAMQITYGFYRYILVTEELSIVPFTGPFNVAVQQAAVFKKDMGVNYYPSGIALTSVGGTPSAGQYHYAGSGVYNFAAADAGQGIVISYEYADPNTSNNAPQHLNLTLLNGATNQPPWSYLSSKHPSQALGYSQIASIASSSLYLGFSPELPNYTYELALPYRFGGGTVDANPADCITQVLTNTAYGIGFPSANLGSLSAARTCWTANGFFVSPIIENQQSASGVLKEWLDAGMVGAYWSEGLLKFVPYCDTSVVGNGVLYQPSTNPVINLTDSDFITNDNEDPVRVTRTPWMDAYNRVQVNYLARVNDYNPELMYEQDEGSVQRYGLRIEDPQGWDFITTLASAQYASSMRLQRYVYVRNTYEFKVRSSLSFLEPMDIITINDSTLGLTNFPVRIQRVEDDPEKGLTITAEDFIYGAAAPAYNPKVVNSPSDPLPGQEDPGNTTIIAFEAPSARLGFQAGNMLYGFVNGSNANWGGCHVWISYDGSNYQLLPTLPNGAVNFPARIGTLTAGLLAYGGANPDNGNTLSIQTSDATPLSSTTANGARDNVTLSAIVTNGPSFGPSLELLSYQTATLTGIDKYNLTTLYRGVYGTPASGHSIGDLFARLDEASFQIQFDPTYIGKTIYVKFTSFNLLGQNEQNLSDVTAYAINLNGTTGAIAIDTGFINTSAPGYTAYRPLSNPLTAVDAGGSATINIASFIMALSGPSAQVQIVENSGAITGLNYSTTYFVFFDDPKVVGGAVSYQVSTVREDVYKNMTRFFVGSIGTPSSGHGATVGNNDGGAGGQYAKTMTNLPTTFSASGWINPGNAIDNIAGDFAEADSNSGTGNLVYIASGFPSFANWFTSNVLTVMSYVTAIANGTAYVDYSIDNGTTWLNLRTVTTVDTSIVTSTVSLPLTVPTQNVQVRVTSPGAAAAASTSAKYAGTGANDAAVGTLAWTNPTNAQGNQTSVFASAVTNSTTAVASEYLKLTNFGFSIPSTGTIVGIKAEVLVNSNSTYFVGGSPPKPHALYLSDSSIKLYKAGSIIGSDHAVGGQWPTTPTIRTYGGSTDLWGTTWTFTDINNSGFGIGISTSLRCLLLSGAETDVYSVKITVYYNDSSGPGAQSATVQLYDISQQVTT